ncbi:hypothetical protein HZA87_05895 [Candidatus Uhrbacteria bacterium]|nr:hypothetical protein [Candidatus Uhrbacteria bacterium]
MPVFRAWRPVKLKILVCNSKRERINVTLSIQDVDGRFNSPWGSKSISIICWKEPDDVKDQCTGEVTIWPRASGKPKLLIVSPDSDFTSTTIEAVERAGPLATHSLDRSPVVIKLPEERSMKYLKWILVAVIPAIGLVGYSIHKLSATPETPVEQTAQSTEPATAPTESSQEPTVEAPPPTPVVEAAAPAPETPPAVPAPESAAAPLSANCVLADPNLTPDAEGIVLVKCGTELYQAKAVYKGEGQFEFNKLEEDPIGP